MIKPFKVLETRTEPDGSTGVIYEVTRVESTAPNRTKTLKMSTYMSVPKDQDVDQFLFEKLSAAGWL
ncbi:hypothetical protein UFOVP33_5 [uncultured Caudovirales phage]|uniref:Uncharacterized protein n=1 Tax=uncultured Caudovirales phage TaxID=2100421 RepID=A0A6J5KM85_9CAUD|nr:hypothetical protein UFOVP33_5 [uncultured Caudovirales phage]